MEIFLFLQALFFFPFCKYKIKVWFTFCYGALLMLTFFFLIDMYMFFRYLRVPNHSCSTSDFFIKLFVSTRELERLRPCSLLLPDATFGCQHPNAVHFSTLIFAYINCIWMEIFWNLKFLEILDAEKGASRCKFLKSWVFLFMVQMSVRSRYGISELRGNASRGLIVKPHWKSLVIRVISCYTDWATSIAHVFFHKLNDSECRGRWFAMSSTIFFSPKMIYCRMKYVP